MEDALGVGLADGSLRAAALECVRHRAGPSHEAAAAHILRLLRFGPTPTRRDPDDPLTWANVTRSATGTDIEGLWFATLTLAHAAGSPFALQVTQTPSGPMVHAGVADPGVLHAVRRTLAPAVLVEPHGGPMPASWTHAGRPRRLPLESSLHGERPGPVERLTPIPGTWTLRVQGAAVPNSAVERTWSGLHDVLTVLEPQRAVTHATTDIQTTTIEDPRIGRSLVWLDSLVEAAERARSERAWDVRVLISADDRTAHGLMAAFAGEPSGSDGDTAGRFAWDPRSPSMTGGGLLTSSEFARLLQPPRVGSGFLKVAGSLPAGRLQPACPRPLHLGVWTGTDDPAVLDVDDLSTHAFLTGVTGSGKSTTLFQLLAQLWHTHEIPWLLVDPVKNDHAPLAEAIGDDLAVLDGRGLRMSVLEPLAGTPRRGHLGRLSSAMRAAFAMPAPVPFVLQQVLDLVIDRPSPVTLHDVASEAADHVAHLGYGAEVEGNVRAALLTRLALLSAPAQAPTYCAHDNSQLELLINRPTLIRLGDIGDDEERAFLAAMLVVYVAESAYRRGPTGRVGHVTVIEEAHRLVAEPRPAAPDVADSAGVAARLVTGLLAEVRAYGEAIVIVDQSPGAVARQVVRNTGVKLVHRIVERADREDAASAIGLEEPTALLTLDVGMTLISTPRQPLPQVVSVHRLPGRAIAPPASRPTVDHGWPCCGTESARHHAAERGAAVAENAIIAWLLGADRGRVDQDLSRAAVSLGATPACLAHVGLRRAVARAERLGVLAVRGADVTAAWTAGRHPQGLIGRGTARFSTCDLCAAPCTAILLGDCRPASMPGALRMVTGRTGSVDGLASAVTAVAAELVPLLSGRTARAAALCRVAHSLDRARRSVEDLRPVLTRQPMTEGG